MTGYRRFTLSLAAVCALVFWLDAPAGLARGRAPQAGVHLTPNGYRVPVYGMSRVKAKDGTFSNECLRLSNQQIEATRFGRSVSRAMARWSPHATVQAAGDPSKATFRIIYTDAPGQGFNDSRDGAARKRALEASMAAWSQVLQGTIPIVIQARMEAPEDRQRPAGVGGPGRPGRPGGHRVPDRAGLPAGRRGRAAGTGQRGRHRDRLQPRYQLGLLDQWRRPARQGQLRLRHHPRDRARPRLHRQLRLRDGRAAEPDSICLRRVHQSRLQPSQPADRSRRRTRS